MIKYKISLGGIHDEVALVSQEDYDRIASDNWWYDGKYACHNRNGKKVYMHRLIMDAPDGMDVDHINGDVLDNRRENLRVVSHSINMANRPHPNKNNKCGLVGVHPQKNTKKWRVQVMINGKTHHIGYFSDKREAHKAYKKAVAERISNVSTGNSLE